MTLTVVNEGENLLLGAALGSATPEDLTLKLYTNSPTISPTLAAGGVTEMTGQGYAAKTLTKASWSVATNGGGAAEGSYAQQSFAFTSGGPTTINGYFVVGATSAKLYWIEAFASAHTVQNDGDTIRVTPKITSASA